MRALLIAIVVLLGGTSLEASWYLKSGERIEGQPSAFDYTSKSLVFEKDGSNTAHSVEAKNLSLRGRQRLLISPLFHESYPEMPSWPPEKRHLLLLTLTAPAAMLLVGFWIAGILLARKVHPIRACLAFLGSWMIGAAFVCFYLFFAARIGGGHKTVLFGVGVGLLFLSFYVSAVYQCSVFRGLLIFLLQIFVAAFLSIVTLAVSETIQSPEAIDQFWNENVFDPVGMLEYHWTDQVKSASSSFR